MAPMDRTLAVHYGSISFFTSVLHNIFLLYHIETFVSIYKIDKMSFWIGEVIFLVWNSCNDPLFGWISDRKYLSSSRKESDIILARLRALSWNGPLFVIAFLLFWFLWTNPSLQFALCLCLYDSFLTMVDLHHSSLLADLTVSAENRTSLNFYSSLFGALGAASVFLSYAVWDSDNMYNFQLCCGALALLSIIGFIYSTTMLKKVYKRASKSEDYSTDRSQVSCSDNDVLGDKKAIKAFILDLAGHKNFKWFAAMNLIQVFHCHFNSNFFPLFLETLLGDSVPQLVCSLILGVSFVAPHINNLYFLSLCRRLGTYTVIYGLFWLKLSLSLLMFLVGPSNVWLLALFIASNRVFTEGTCKLLSLVISDLVDEDCVIHQRRSAVSALMFGTAAFLSKPGQTLAPLVGTWLLSMQTGHDVFKSGNELGSIKLSVSPDHTGSSYRHSVFQLLVLVPIVCAAFQIVLWSRFSLHGSRLQWIKNIRSGFYQLNV